MNFSKVFPLSGEDNAPIKFPLLQFEKESQNVFWTPLSNYTGPLMFDNIGRSPPASASLRSSRFMLKSWRANKYHPSTIATHVNDLCKILIEESKTACIILSDSGADLSPKNVANSLLYYLLFKELNYDMLSVSTYAARYSVCNTSGCLCQIC